MKNLTPIPRDQRPPIPAFTPVPRLSRRYDGWTPERQRAFIEALADTGSVSTACRMVNYFSKSATAGSTPPSGERDMAGESHRFAHAQAATMTTTLSAPAADRTAAEDEAAQAIAAFDGVDLDPQAQSEILAILESCAERRREIAPEDDPERAFIPIGETNGFPYKGELEPGIEIEDERDFKPEERSWTLLGDEPALAAIDAAVAAIEAEQALPEPERAAIEQQRADEFGATARRNNLPAKPAPGPRLSELPETGEHHVMHGGPNFQQRHAARRATETCIEAARREWIAAETEESWAAWKGGP